MRSRSFLGLCLMSILTTACAGADGDARTDDDGGVGEESSSSTESGDAPSSATTMPSTTTETSEAESSGDDTTPDVGESSGDEDTTTGDDDSTGHIDMTTGEMPIDLDDGDSSVEPAVLLQFRATAGAPVDIAAPLFNAEPLDVRGARYSETIDPATDETDHLRFSIVPGESDPYVRVTIECDDPAVRADIIDAEEDVVGFATCGAGEVAILLVGATSTEAYGVVVGSGVDEFATTEYTVALDAFCFGGCNYQPFEG